MILYVVLVGMATICYALYSFLTEFWLYILTKELSEEEQVEFYKQLNKSNQHFNDNKRF